MQVLRAFTVDAGRVFAYIRHVRLRKEGSTRAIILIHLPSLREFFEARMSTPKPAAISKRKAGAALS
jgi:hypothetical protein